MPANVTGSTVGEAFKLLPDILAAMLCNSSGNKRKGSCLTADNNEKVSSTSNEDARSEWQHPKKKYF